MNSYIILCGFITIHNLFLSYFIIFSLWIRFDKMGTKENEILLENIKPDPDDEDSVIADENDLDSEQTSNENLSTSSIDITKVSYFLTKKYMEASQP